MDIVLSLLSIYSFLRRRHFRRPRVAGGLETVKIYADLSPPGLIKI
jgi:hypothetical protein